MMCQAFVYSMFNFIWSPKHFVTIIKNDLLSYAIILFHSQTSVIFIILFQIFNILWSKIWNYISFTHSFVYMLKAIHSNKIIASLVRKNWLIIKRIHIFEIITMWTRFDLSTQINLFEPQSLDPRTM